MSRRKISPLLTELHLKPWVPAGEASPQTLWPNGAWIGAWFGLACLNFGLRSCNEWLEQFDDGFAAAASDDRRRTVTPWLPWFESSLVPLRRREDQPGAQAAKLAWRVRVPPLPWEAGDGSVFAFASLRPRPAALPASASATRH